MNQKSLRLGINCAVIDPDERVLLSRREDFNIWNLPGGRLDPGEMLDDAAAREVREETGIIVQIDRAVGLYYTAGVGRMTIAFAGHPTGGELQQTTYETRENRFFAANEIPPNNFSVPMTADALADTRPAPYTIIRSPQEIQRIRWALRYRYVKNLLRGRPEPRWARFNVWATAIVWQQSSGGAQNRIVTIPNRRMRALPRVYCDGTASPWEQLTATMREFISDVSQFQWVGYWQDTSTDSIEFVFSAVATPDLGDSPSNGAEWSAVPNTALNERDTLYVSRTLPPRPDEPQPVWWLRPQEAGVDRISISGSAK